MTADPDSGAPPRLLIDAVASSWIRRDLFSAYAAAATRFASSVLVAAMVFRYVGHAEFAMLALVRGTIGILNYTSLGLAPALIHHTARIGRIVWKALPPDAPAGSTLEYESREDGAPPLARLHATTLAIAFATAMGGALLTAVYAVSFERLYHIPARLTDVMPIVVEGIGIGIVLRLASDVSGAVLQGRNRITLDNLILVGGDLLWITAAAVCVALPYPGPKKLALVSWSYALSGGAVFYRRYRAAGQETGVQFPRRRLLDPGMARSLVGFGLLVVVAQLADYLYTPTDYILIDRLLSPIDIASYAPAVQIESGLLLLVTGLSAVLLPKAALAHAAGSRQTVRRYYVRGTLASTAMLVVASFGVWLVSPMLLKFWLGDPMPGTQAILPIVLACTMFGGSSTVGRSILLAVGKVRPFAVSVLIAGIVNVACSYIFVRYLRLGLAGILLGTVVAVVGRCGLWMPWYVLRVLNEPAGEPLTKGDSDPLG